MGDDENVQKVSRIVNAVVNDAIETPMRVLVEKTKDTSKEKLMEQMNALTAEMIKTQYALRELATVEWYKNQLDDLRKNLHDVFERHREFFKEGSGGANWLAILSVAPGRVKGFHEFKADDKGPYYFRYFKDSNDLNACIDLMRRRDTNKMLCVPIFKAA